MTISHFDQTTPSRTSLTTDSHGRLLDIVGELLLENQKLRFQVAHLEQELAQTSHALNQASAIYAMLLP